MLTILRKRLGRQEGFTLIELLVVILIIGILAAIAIPSFLNQKGKGEDATAKSAARETATALETWYTDNGNYTPSDTEIHQIEGTLPAVSTNSTRAASAADAGKVYYTSPGASGYTIRVWSKPSGRMFEIVKNGGTVTRSCLPVNDGGCNATGSW